MSLTPSSHEMENPASPFYMHNEKQKQISSRQLCPHTTPNYVPTWLLPGFAISLLLQ